MKEIIEDIRVMLKEGLFKDEQHVRFSLVGRICQKLGWDIWNPAEFYTEYKVDKIPTQILPKESNGRVDIALFLSENKPKAAEVFMEIKAPGKLMPSLKDCEDQLHVYTGHHRIAIGILTDGIIWRFYVPPVGGYFKDTLFAQLNLEKDDIDALVNFFNDVLRKDNFRKKAQERAEEMFEELGRIMLVQTVKPKAIQIAEETGLLVYLIAQRLLKQNEGIDMEIEEIQRLWDKTIPGGDQEVEPPPPPLDSVRVFIHARGIKASGLYNTGSKQLTLYKGSEVFRDYSGGLIRKYVELRASMLRNGKLVLDTTGTKYILREDTLFNAPSGASGFVLGRSSNGFTDWVDSQGNKLDKYRKDVD